MTSTASSGKVSNEDESGSAAVQAWQNHVANVITAYEATGGRKRHLVLGGPYAFTNAQLLSNSHLQIVALTNDGSGHGA
jgi:hypothetical protein